MSGASKILESDILALYSSLRIYIRLLILYDVTDVLRNIKGIPAYLIWYWLKILLLHYPFGYLR